MLKRLPLIAILALGTMLAAPAGRADAILVDTPLTPWKGDLDGLLKRTYIRVLTAYNPLFFSYDGIEPQGLMVEGARHFEARVNRWFRKKHRRITMVLLPVPRDKIIPYLIAGRGDIAAANLTITPGRSKIVAFANPGYTGVRELVVSGPAGAGIAKLDDLSRAGLYVRKSSSYHEHLVALNNKRKSAGKPPIPLTLADENLEDYDLLDMVNAGVIPAIIVDSHKAALWQKVFKSIKVHQDLSINDGGAIAMAVRKGNPKLLALVNRFAKEFRKGTLLGNVLINRYLGSTKWMENSWSEAGRAKYQASVHIIKEYAEQYDFDWLMIAAQGYQESTLDQSKRSHAGAVGLMQILPATAADRNVAIADIHKIEQNVHAGVKYLRFLRSRYFSADEIRPKDKVLFSFAAYNAGPRNIAKARRRAAKMGLDRNRWFGNVEVAAARTISREPVNYVRNIFKYYVTYRRLEEIRKNREAAARK
jgi:membrane-bound lytic murein transglycosylase MltF